MATADVRVVLSLLSAPSARRLAVFACLMQSTVQCRPKLCLMQSTVPTEVDWLHNDVLDS